MKVLVKLKVADTTFMDIVRRVIEAGAHERLSLTAVNLDGVAVVPESKNPYATVKQIINVEDLKAALAPLVAIADAYDTNDLDDEARKYWGTDDDPHTNTTPPRQIELYTGRGGQQLLTLEHCLAARRVVRGEPLQAPAPPVDRVRLTRPVGRHPVGRILKIVEVIPHGGYYDDSVQYLADDGTYIPSERAEVL